MGQELISVATDGDCAMEAIISAAETGFTGSLVGSSIPYKHTERERREEMREKRQKISEGKSVFGFKKHLSPDWLHTWVR